MNNIIKNQAIFLGNFDDVSEILKKIKSERSLVDFNKIEPMERDLDDLALDNYINFCLNVYIQENPDIKDKLINTFKFVGRTREVPYEFNELTSEQINSAKANYQTKKIKSDTVAFLNKIRSKSIFNGYMIRDAIWGTGSGAFKAKVKDNRIDFLTYDKAPILVFMKLSKQYPDIKIDYTYQIDGKNTSLTISKGEVRYVLDENKNYDEPNLFNLISNNVFI
jgi:hypothetical protein